MYTLMYITPLISAITSMVMYVSNLFRVPFWQMYVRRTDENISKYLSSRHKVYLQSHAIWSPTIQIIMFFIGISLSILFYCVKPSRRNRYDEMKVKIEKDDDDEKVKSSPSSSSVDLLNEILVGFILILFPIVVTSIYFYICNLHAPVYRSYAVAPEIIPPDL